MNLSDEKRKELLELCEKATPGEWFADVDEPHDCVIWAGETFLANVGSDHLVPVRPDNSALLFDVDINNAKFVAASRTALPDALKDLAEAEAALLREKWHSHAMEQDRSTYIGVIESAESELGANARGSHGTDLIPKIRALKAERDSAEALLKNMGELLEDVPLDESDAPTGWWDRRRRVLKEWRERK